MFAMGLFFLAFVAVTRLVGQTLPRLSALLLLTGALGAQAGSAFEVVVVARAKGLELQAGSLETVFNAPGILFPMTWFALGVCVLYAKVAPAWVGIALALAGVAFPVSRIGTVGEIAVVADVLFVVALSGLAMVVLPVTSPARLPRPRLRDRSANVGRDERRWSGVHDTPTNFTRAASRTDSGPSPLSMA